MIVGPENCAMQSLGLQPLPAEIAHYAVPAASRPAWIAHCANPTTSQPPQIAQTTFYVVLVASLPEKIVQSLPFNPHVCCMSLLKFSSVFADIFLAMHVALSLDLESVHLPLSSLRSMPFMREGSKNIDGSSTRAAVERVFTSMSIYEDTKLIVGKDIELK